VPIPSLDDPLGGPEQLQGFRFTPPALGVMERRPGVSAFMRIRNGEEFLEPTIRSHIGHFDEIVALYNQCTDRTEDILLRLRQEFGRDRLRVVHYVDRVFPPGSEGHAATPADSPHSLVNYYNAALCATRYAVATKLDDDHLALEENTAQVVQALRRGFSTGQALQEMRCFSGLNLIRGPEGEIGVFATTPLSGGGDIGFFPVRPDTYFVHDRRFERFQRGDLKRRWVGFLYWHLKYLKAELGFANYELDANPASRYAKRRRALADAPPTALRLRELPGRLAPRWSHRLAALVNGKKALTLTRNAAVATAFPDVDVLAALARTSDARWVQQVLQASPRAGVRA
jgi:hypothetical protein